MCWFLHFQELQSGMLTYHPSTSALMYVISLIAIVFLFAALVGRKSSRVMLPYRRKAVLTPWERKALPELLRQLPPGCHLCPQVRRADLLAITARDPSARQSALNRVASKSLDFVVVDIASGDALLVVELDDRTHDRPNRRERDALVDAALRVAGIPIARFRPAQRLDISQHLQASAFPQLEAGGSLRRLGFA